ncbi:GtrA family protein [Paenibacillus sp. NPDC058071]|uniref:GtrA family protein n=1 Tax=Paenibacillus sp. NPDC058071 TaxID=3346326 RepID=UPI0036DEBB9C
MSATSGEERRRWPAFKQFILFNLVGLVNTAVDFAIFGLLVWAGLHAAASQVVSYAAGMANSYWMNSRFTFKSSAGASADGPIGGGRLLRFVLLNLAVLGVSVSLLYLAVERLTWNPFIAKIVVTCLTVLLNFVGSKRWVFRPQKQVEN